MNDHPWNVAHGFARILLSSLFVLVGGCGAASSVATAAVKSQIDSRCGSAGLKGCPELAEGAIAYATGDDAEGETKLRAAAANPRAGQAVHETARASARRRRAQHGQEALRDELDERVARGDITIAAAVRRCARSPDARTEYARRVGVSPQLLFELEHGMDNPRLKTLATILAPSTSR